MKTYLPSMVACLSLALAACGKDDAAESRAEDHETEPARAGDGHVDLSTAQITAAGIEIVQAGSANIRETLPLYGVITPNAERMREVIARYPGVIRDVTKQVGDTVRQGERLSTVESDESLEAYSVVAPIAGVVTARNANPGEQTADKVLFTVADLSSVWVELSLFPRDLTKVRVGQQVRVANTDAGIAAQGKITYVAPVGTAASQTLAARVLLENAERRWAPGLYVTAEVVLSEVRVNVAVRNAAIQTLDGRTVVFARTNDGFQARPIRVGRSDSEQSEVVEGLSADEAYVAGNSFILKAELGKGDAEHGHD